MSTVVIGNFIHCPNRFEVEVLEQHFLAIVGNKIDVIAPLSELQQYKSAKPIKKTITLTPRQLLIPGLVDTHIHGVQLPNGGLGYDKPLLDWLTTYTYPLEVKFRDSEFARKVFDVVVRTTLRNGTTTACYFASLYVDASLLLAEAAARLGQRALVGKLNMSRNSYQDYWETPEENITNTRRFVQAVLAMKKDTIQPIITPRFAISVEMDLMKELAKIAKEYNLRIQSHICENTAEVAIVHKLFDMGYAQVYDQAGLLTTKTVMAHGVFLTDEEVTLLASRGTSVAHCPQSNTLLKSGLCDVKRLIKGGVTVGLGTDVAGGASPSVIAMMRDALTVSIHLSMTQKDYKPYSYKDVFYLATLGGAEALSMQDEIGNFQVGKKFDALIIDVGADDHSFRRNERQLTPLELLQKFIFVGDDRHILTTFVDGVAVSGQMEMLDVN